MSRIFQHNERSAYLTAQGYIYRLLELLGDLPVLTVHDVPAFPAPVRIAVNIGLNRHNVDALYRPQGSGYRVTLRRVTMPVDDPQEDPCDSPPCSSPLP